MQRDASRNSAGGIRKRDTDLPIYNLSVPVDHFPNDPKYEPHTEDTFPLRYILDTTYYKEGGPVIILAAGEGPADSQEFLLTDGFTLAMLVATNGIGVR